MIARALVVAALAAVAAPRVLAPASLGAWEVPAVHGTLKRSAPADGDTLSTAPRQLSLEFTEAVELRVASLTLLAPDGTPVTLSALRHDGERRTHLIADVQSPLTAGTYAIRWGIVGRDGHPIRGELHFTLRADAAGLAPPPARDTAPAARGVDSIAALRDGDEGEPAEFDATSPAFAAIRTLGFVGLLGVIGALGFRAGVLASLRRRRGSDGSELVAAALPRVAQVGMAAGAVLVAAAGLRLLAQVRAVYGDGGFDGGAVVALLTGTTWGWGWMLQLAAATTALGALIATRRCTPPVAGDVTLTVAVIALAVSAAMSGHPAAAHPMPVAIGLDAVHVLAAGGWIGTLLFVAVVGIPAAVPSTLAGGATRARDVIVAFSPLALACGAVSVGSGLGSAWLQLRSFEALWTSEYGRVLLIKLACVAAVLAAGAYNWRVATPRLTDPAGVRRVRRSAVAELGFALLVLAVTAVLVATPPPTELMDAHDAEGAAVR